MPTKSEHREKASQNEFFVSSLGNPFWDWAVVGVFYAALHYVEAYLATKNIHSGSHPLRDSHVQRDPSLRAIYAKYRELKDESRDARYDAAVIFSQADVKRLQANLDTIKNLINPLL